MSWVNAKRCFDEKRTHCDGSIRCDQSFSRRAADKKWLTEDDAVGSPAFSKFRKLEPDQACVVYKSDVQDYNKVYSSQVVELLKLYPIGGKESGKVEKPGENLSTNFNKEKYL